MVEGLPARASWRLCVIIVLSASWTSGVAAVENDLVSHLDVVNPSVVQPIEPTDRIHEGKKFVQVEVVDVKNPRGYPVTLTVEYHTKAHEKIFLGSFSLYPSDNPGKFIVATQGKVRKEGALVGSLVIPNDFKREDVLRVGIRRMKFLKN